MQATQKMLGMDFLNVAFDDEVSSSSTIPTVFLETKGTCRTPNPSSIFVFFVCCSWQAALLLPLF